MARRNAIAAASRKQNFCGVDPGVVAPSRKEHSCNVDPSIVATSGFGSQSLTAEQENSSQNVCVCVCEPSKVSAAGFSFIDPAIVTPIDSAVVTVVISDVTFEN